MSYTLCLLILIIMLCDAQTDRKSSLTFVIDATRSMSKVLRQVEESAFTLFDVVLQSNESPIDNFILVTFDDPNVTYVIDTRDKDEFKTALDNIELVNGRDCPEYSLSGIKMGIEKSLAGSTIYVFTDASASDYKMISQVSDLAQRKEIQVIFMLTGKCEYDPGYDYYGDVYLKLANKTSGQVFNLLDDNIIDIFEFVLESAKSRRTFAKSIMFPPGHGHTLNYTKDIEMRNTTITIAGKGVKFSITGPDGTTPDVDDWVTLENVMGVKVYEKKDGVHTITVDCESDTHLMVSARSSISFRYGFSTFVPSSLNDTAVKPLPGETYLAIQVFGDFYPKSVCLLDVDENIITNVTLETLDDKKKLFITKKIVTPSSMFRIAVTGTHLASNMRIHRISRVIEPINIYIEEPEGKKPTSYIEDGPRITVELNTRLRLKCKVNAYPEPIIIWENKESGKTLKASKFMLDFPNDYISIHEIENVNKNGTYMCTSTNDYGDDIQSVVVETKPKSFFEIIEAPKDKTVEFNTTSHITCKVNAFPSVNVTWLKNEINVSKEDHITISPDGSVMTIHNMTPAHEGNYTCVVKNILNETSFPFKVKISGIEAPFIEKQPRHLYLNEGSSANLSCRITKGKPRPNIKWYYEDITTKTFVEITEEKNKETVTLHDIRRNNPKLYICEAQNIVKSVHKEITLDIEWKPQIHPLSNYTYVVENDDLNILCRIKDGKPKPVIQWFYKHSSTESFKEIDAHKDEESLLLRNINRNHRGTYKCLATNKIGNDTIETTVVVEYPPHIQKAFEMMTHTVGDEVTFTCLADGVPEPSIKWTKEDEPLNSSKYVSSSDHHVIFQADLDSRGLYKCSAINKLGTAMKTVIIEVEKAPNISIEGSPKIIVEYDEPLQLKCHVSANPLPRIRWTDISSTKTLPGTIDESKFPYDSVNIVNIEKVTENATYVCEAENDLGTDREQIDVETMRKSFFEVVTKPKDTTIEYNSESKLYCKVNAHPPAKITWYKNSEYLTRKDGVEVSFDGTLTFKNMQPFQQGTYVCVASNGEKQEIYKAEVYVSGLQKPEIDKTSTQYYEVEGSNISLMCRIIKGKPTPEIRWFQKTKRTKSTEIVSAKNMEVLTVSGVNRKDQSTYECKAENIMGKDSLEMEVHVEYPPSIEGAENYDLKAGEKVHATCSVDGYPKPNVAWFKDGVSVPEYMISDDHSLKFVASLKDRGVYTCVATNKHGTASKNVTVDVYVLHIKRPEKLKVEEDSDVNLMCKNYGRSKVLEKTWSFKSKGPESILTPIELPKSGKRNKFLIKNIKYNQGGTYVCNVTKENGERTIVTYEIDVYTEVNINEDQDITAVEGDKVLKLYCNATSEPKPKIAWFRNSFKLKTEGDTLLLRDIKKSSTQGKYMCKASNDLFFDVAVFSVKVQSYPTLDNKNKTLPVQEGETVVVPCDLPYKDGDALRWYRDRKKIKENELTIYKVKQSDAGLYTCRVSNSSVSVSANTWLKVGSKPRFLSTVEEEVAYGLGETGFLNCLAEGTPIPQVSWSLNSVKLSLTKSVHVFKMDHSHLGKYECTSENEFGKISRTIEVTFNECLLKIDQYTEKQPLILTPYFTWPTYKYISGYLRIPKNHSILLLCQNKIKYFNSPPYVSAFCNKEAKLEIEGAVYDYSDIKCTEEVRPQVKKTGLTCYGEDSELIKIVYEIVHKTIEVYEVCLDVTDYAPIIFTKHKMQLPMPDANPKVTWLNDGILEYNFDKMYENYNQIISISSTLSRWFHRDDKCVFSKRQLVNALDVFPGLPQRSTFIHLNVAPHWSTCSSENWNDLESRVRHLAMSMDGQLNVWTGVTEGLTLSDSVGNNQDIYIVDDLRRPQRVSMYFWKVVQNPVTRTSLAIIQLNIPDISSMDVYKYKRCRDICDLTMWMNGDHWQDVARGYTYCCELSDFEASFRFEGTFGSDVHNVLYNSKT